MEFITNAEELRAELKLIIDMFHAEDENITIVHNQSTQDKYLFNSVEIITENQKMQHEKRDIVERTIPLIEIKKLTKRFTKLCLYSALAKFNKKDLPWGSLTGVRPTKLAYDLLKHDVKPALLSSTLTNTFFLSPQKAELVSEILENQKLNIKNDKFVNLYINIPFCTSRCSYCSFLAGEISKCNRFVEPYIDALIKEIRAVKQLILDKAYLVKTIYMGGGTPTSLTAEQLDRILNEISFPMVSEFTVEAGRPDTITKEKLDVLKKHNVTRISINPQTFNDNVLKKIGRNHTSSDIIECYKLAMPYNFQINMDFIAGLTGEGLNSFKNSIDIACELMPHNITVHTLAIKNGSRLKESEKETINYEANVTKMVDYAYNKLKSMGYKPYYMYRQKHMLSNLENVGYHRDNTQCIFNIDSMEEIANIVACGAGAISKRIFPYENRLERQPNVKDIKGYIERVDEMIEKKNNFF